MSILAFYGSPRKNGNSSLLLDEFIKGAQKNGAFVETVQVQNINIKYCRGCLRCNLLKRCAIRNDDWERLSQKIIAAETLVFASPVYFHHLPAPLKAIIDRFRSFNHVQLLKNGLQHTPWHTWRKHIILILSLGNSTPDDAKPIVDLFTFICNELGNENQLTTVIGTRLAVSNQIIMNEAELKRLYEKLKIPVNLAEGDFQKKSRLNKKMF
jgi:putative NADPH-quinone reductase